MNKKACREILAELEALFVAPDSALCWAIARELAEYTIAFVTSKDGELAPAGTGTLVSFRESHYFLTAAHVWEEVLRKSDSIRIPLKESPTRFAIAPGELVPHSLPISAPWNEWGPDITLLRIPPERVGSFIAVGRPFYALSLKKEIRVDCRLETTFLVGAPALRGQFSPESAIPEVQGMNVLPYSGAYSSIELQRRQGAQSDFIDIFVDTTQPDVAATFKGVSGGGLWEVSIFKGDDGGIRTIKNLVGVAYWEIPDKSSLLIRCHGPNSIGLVLCTLYD